ncbi:class I adenylate-forming enzyme family protein [Pseudonocardia xishanensis]|uniref:Acyl-CoA synthetase n=1 Tax=Pseudonocardia xishanensis TaxID=630995 RepID=A0ABP8RV94_9PSEU
MGIDVTTLVGRRASHRWERCSVGDVFERVAVARPDAEALVGVFGAFSEPGFERLSYARADALANRFAQALLARGLGRGDRVLFVCDNSVEAFVAKIGVAKAGCVAVPVNPSQTPDVLAHALALTEPALVVADAGCRRLPDAGGLPIDVTIPIGGPVGPGETGFREFCAEGSANPPDVDIAADDIWQILFTSGTTAMPKGVMISHQYSYLTALSWALSYTRGLDHESRLRMACFVPIVFHVGDAAYTMPALFTGGSIVLGRRHDVAAVADTIAAERATAVIAGGIELANRLVDVLEARGAAAVESLTCIVYGLGLPSAAMAARLQALRPGISMLGIAGQTESVPAHRFVASAFPEKHAEALERHANVVGWPNPLLASKVVDVEDGTDAAPGAVGELVYRSPVMTAGYYRDEEATRQAFDGGWFHSGDLGSTDPGGERLIVGRLKDMIKTGGENVAGSRVEAVVAEHPGVDRVAVVGLPDERWGEAVTAVVVPKPGESVVEADLIAFARARLAGYETPKRVVVVDDLPTDFVGKVRKYALREQLIAGAADVGP